MEASRQPSEEALAWAKRNAAKGRRLWPLPIIRGFPSPYLERATPHEVTLIHATLAERFVSQLPVRLIGENAYESDRRMQKWHAAAWN